MTDPLENDAVVVGAGPNGLAAAVTLARAGRSVLLVEARDEVGGGASSAELTLPGFVHDVCSAVHPLGAASPAFRRLSLDRHGLRWVQPDAPVAHALERGEAAVAERSVAATAAGLDDTDAAAYRGLLEPLVVDVERILAQVLGPLRPPRHPIGLARFGLSAVRSADALASARFRGEKAKALLMGHAAHSILPLTARPTAGPALLFAVLSHAVGWPIPRGGAQAIADALAGRFRSLRGEIKTGWHVASLAELPPSRAVLLDLVPRQVLTLAGDRLPPGYRRQLERFRHGPGAFKVDYARDGPIPWLAEGCARAGTVHLGGTADEVVAEMADVWNGRHPERPFVLVAQQSRFDDTRAPAGRHTAWAYCHVPPGSTVDMTERITAQIERFAPGFRERVLARHVRGPAQLEAENPNLVGGDISGGAMTLRQLLARPALRVNPYTTPLRGLYLCSSSTPPGAGVHGMSGWWAARTALRRL
jgi:phytoene dehydrogenase-like protein